MKNIKNYLILLFLTVNILMAGETRYANAVLEGGVGARALSMGGAYVALSNDPDGFFWNPAGLAFISEFQVGSMYADMLGNLSSQSQISVAMPVFGGATVSVAWLRTGVDNIPRYLFDDTHTAFERIKNLALPLTSEPTDYFNAYNDAYFITFAKLKRVNLDLGWQYFEVPVDIGYGMNFKMLNYHLDQNSGSGIGVDGGLAARFGLSEIFEESYYGTLSFGLNVQDIPGTKITWDTDSKHKDTIDRNFKYGFAYEQPLHFMDSKATFVYDINSIYGNSTHLGTELLYHSILALRAGYNSTEFSAGAGLYLWKLVFDYAYQGHELGNTHRISISFHL
jgi:hypothetical protein